MKFRTEDGNWDMVGNNRQVFFIRDAIKFPDVIHALKPDPVTFRQEPNPIFDFMSNTPESMHMLTWLLSPYGIPKNYRIMRGSGVNTYRFVNAEGEGVLVKFHWLSQQGEHNLTQAEANAIQATDLGHASKDLYEAIERGDYPRWELNVQVMSDDEHPELDFDPLDDTKLWPEEDFPYLPVGGQPAPRGRGGQHQPDRWLDVVLGGQPRRRPAHQLRAVLGRRASGGRRVLPRVPPVRLGADHEGPDRAAEQLLAGRPPLPEMADWERDDLILNLVTNLARCDKHIQEKMVWHFSQCDSDYGRRVAEGPGLAVNL